jgi:hypothetical protein
MPNSIREQLLQSVLTRLQPVVANEGATLHRSPALAISRERCPALIVFAESDVVTDRANDRSVRELAIKIVALSRGQNAESHADRMISASHAVLMAEPTFGGLAIGIHETGCDWETEESDALIVSIPARYRIVYRTLAADLTTRG